jgi:tetratricopeptide (TPR) repeat protein
MQREVFMKAILVALSLLCSFPVFAQTEPNNVAKEEIVLEQQAAAQKSQEGLALMKQKKYTAARDAFLEATTKDPNSAEYSNQYGLALLKTGDAFSAVEEFQTAIDLGMTGSAIWDSLGNAHEKTKNYSEAETAYSHASELGSKTGEKNAQRMEKLQDAQLKKIIEKDQPRLLKCSKS